MRVLLIHNEYRYRGGEDVAVDSEVELLCGRGHEVRKVVALSREIKNPLLVAWNLPYSHASKAQIATAIKEFQPDIVHCHNLFPLWTPAVYDACLAARVPVVQTLHNFRSFCASALLMRNNRPCEECISGSALPGVLHGCYQGSRLATLPLARMIAYHRKHRTWQTKVQRYIALSNFSKNKFKEAGFPAERISVKPNFVAMPSGLPLREHRNRGPALFVGRLSAEKGIGILLEAWRELNVPLRVVGEAGPGFSIPPGLPQSVVFLGKLSREAVLREMNQASFLVLPSACYENFPLVIAEAFALGLPVVASDIGSLAEIVTEGKTGLKFPAGNLVELRKRVRLMAEGEALRERLSKNAFQAYQELYSPDKNYDQLMGIYRETLETAAARADATHFRPR